LAIYINPDKRRQRRISSQLIADALIRNNGRVTAAAKEIGCAPITIYDRCDEEPEIEEIRRKAEENRFKQINCTSYDVLEKLIETSESDPEVALKALKFALSRSKYSHYRDDQPDGSKENERQSVSMKVSMIENMIKKSEKENSRAED
jgi:hypothetical protein